MRLSIRKVILPKFYQRSHLSVTWHHPQANSPRPAVHMMTFWTVILQIGTKAPKTNRRSKNINIWIPGQNFEHKDTQRGQEKPSSESYQDGFFLFTVLCQSNKSLLTLEHIIKLELKHLFQNEALVTHVEPSKLGHSWGMASPQRKNHPVGKLLGWFFLRVKQCFTC